MFKTYSQFVIICGMTSLGTFKKYEIALYFLISAFVKKGATIAATTNIIIIETIAVTVTKLIFY